ncbi:MAG TPA: hypothetical protein VFU37_01120 [Pyrinomonadaceae bacterium]|nr:hypothetical protein [Pyrinomonadaceae bacterium]
MREPHVRRLMLIRQPVISHAFLLPGVAAVIFVVALLHASIAFGQKPRIPPGGHLAVVADERLAALRSQPDPSARLLRRISRGRFVSIRGSRRSHDGLLFYQVAVTRRTLGWLQSDAVVSAWRPGDDYRLLSLLESADEFDRVARAKIFLDLFPRSPLRSKVLLIYGDAAEEAAVKLSREAERRFERRELPATGAPEFSYYLNSSSLDRYNRQGVIFTFDRAAKKFHYEGWAWREIARRYPSSPEAAEAQKRLTLLAKKIAA